MNEYPRCKYAKGKEAVVVANAAEERSLGAGWYNHPAEAAAGKKLKPEELGGVVPVPLAEEKPEAPKPAESAVPTPPKP